MNATFWNDRYHADTYVYGSDPNAFLKAHVEHLPEEASVIELGAGEGRNAVWLATQGFDVTVADYSHVGLMKARKLAEAHGVSIETEHADVTTWVTDQTYDAVIVTFLHVPPPDRAVLFQLMRKLARPSGWIIAEWFRPAQVTEGYTSGGPPKPELMITADMLKTAFASGTFHVLEEVTTVLREGPYHQGEAAVVHMVWQAPQEKP